MTSAVIVNAYSYRNAGDAAIMLCTAEVLRDLGVDRVDLSTRYLEDADAYADWGVQVLPPVLAFPTSGSSARRLLSFGASALRMGLVGLRGRQAALARRRRRGRLDAATATLVDADVAVVAGGGYFYSAKRRLNLSYLHSALSAWLCARLAPRTVMMPASLGPLHSRLDRELLEWALHDVQPVVRERVSLTASTTPPTFAQPVVEVPDVAFYGAAGLRSVRGRVDEAPAQGSGAPVARVVAMDWTWSRSVGADTFDAYVAAMAEICRRLAAEGYRVVLGGHSRIVEHGQDDIATCEQVAERIREAGGQVEVDPDCDVGHLWEVYEGTAVVVGTRLHSCIMAASVGTPFVALGYQEKAVGITASFDPGSVHLRVDRLDPDAVLAAVRDAVGRREVVAERAQAAQEAIRTHYAAALDVEPARSATTRSETVRG